MEQLHVPHVLLLPFPAQGHIKPMLILAEIFSHAGFQVTFVNTEHSDGLLRRNSTDTITSFCKRYPGFLFSSIPDGLPSDHPRSGKYIVDLFGSMRSVAEPAFRKLLVSIKEENGERRRQPPTCIIADGIMSFAIDVAEELQIPLITFRTFSASCLWTYFNFTKLIEEEEIPIPGEKFDEPVTSIPGLEHILRHRDLPSMCRYLKPDHPVLQFFIEETSAMTRASALILNTFNEIEGHVISKLASLFPKIYTVGPLHAVLKSRLEDSSSSHSSNCALLQQDKSCMTWLDSQRSRSVLYVSFGSLITLTRDQILEFWHGIVGSGKPFLWVGRSDLIDGESGIGPVPVELQQGTRERGCVVGWAPQEEVLAHPAIGGFLTHSGWNSTLESMVAGVPMICWPQISDQQVNSRCVSEVWKIGFDMKDTCDRSTIEKLVRDLMENDREKIMESTDQIARMARDSVKEGGSSNLSLQKMIEEIRSMAFNT